MSKTTKPISSCGCGGELRYAPIKDGKEIMSCNKYAVCLTYDEQFELIKTLQSDVIKYKSSLEKIVCVNAMDYEYKTWAKEALAESS